MIEWLLRWATRLTSVPVLQDFAYGPFGRLAKGIFLKTRMDLARFRKVPIERFKGSYFYPETKGLQVSVTNVCNARCSFCAYRIVADTGRPTGVMKMDVFKKALDEYSALGGKSIDLTPTVGDPLLDPTLIEKIRYCHEHTNIHDICLTTNAIAMCKRDMFKQLVDAGASTVCISLPGLDTETYKQVYGIDRYPDVIKGIAVLLDYNKSRGEPSRVILRFRNPQKPSVLIHSKDFIEHIKPYLSDKVTCNFTVDFDNWGGSIGETDMYGIMKLRKVPTRHNIPCANLFNFMVRYDGSVRLCGCRLKDNEDDGLVVGNIFQNSLAEIGQSKKVHEIIEGFYQGKRPSTCEECSFYIPMTNRRADALQPGHRA
jgi:MoaA/NifB/PqqE/SkfB family radical SAM enzyme